MYCSYGKASILTGSGMWRGIDRRWITQSGLAREEFYQSDNLLPSCELGLPRIVSGSYFDWLIGLPP